MARYLAGVTIRAGNDPLVHAIKQGRERFKRVEAVCGARIAEITGEFVEWSSRACPRCSSVVRYVAGGRPATVDGHRSRPGPRKATSSSLPSPLGSKWRCFVCDRDYLTPEKLSTHEVDIHGADPLDADAASGT